MSSANDTFVSSTFWSERIGYVAALATLDEMSRLESWKMISDTGTKMRQIWTRSFEAAGLKIGISGIPALSAVTILGQDGNVLKTLVTQEMLKRKILASNIFYPSIAHTDSHLDYYEKNLNKVLESISKAKNLEDLLDSKPAQTGFKRLN
jgi:glutamate-1-semialdehyde 2,1-aminomutase